MILWHKWLVGLFIIGGGFLLFLHVAPLLPESLTSAKTNEDEWYWTSFIMLCPTVFSEQHKQIYGWMVHLRFTYHSVWVLSSCLDTWHSACVSVRSECSEWAKTMKCDQVVQALDSSQELTTCHHWRLNKGKYVSEGHPDVKIWWERNICSATRLKTSLIRLGWPVGFGFSGSSCRLLHY